MAVYMFVYFLGIASCSMQGAERVPKRSNWTTAVLFSAVLNSFGGGFIRDVFLLSVFPVVFTPDCLPDITVAMVALLAYLNAQQNWLTQKAMMWFIVIADATGLGTFIAIGVDKAIDSGAGTLIAILSGIVTSQGGGVAAAVFCGVSLLRALYTNVAYRLVALSGVLLYSWWTGSSTDRVSVQHAVVLYTTIGTLACNHMVTEEISKRVFMVLEEGYLLPAMKGTDCFYPFVPYYEYVVWDQKIEMKIIKHLAVVRHKMIHLYHRMRLM